MTSINGTLCFYALLLTAHASFGAEPAEAKPDWVIRTIQLPLELDEFVETGGMALRTLPDLPASSATKYEWEAYLKRSNDAVFPILQTQGIPMHSGSATLYDARTGTLSVRSTVPSVDLIESYVDQLMGSAQRSVNLSLEVWETGEEQARELLKEAQMIADHGPLLNGLKGGAKGNAPITHGCSLRLETTIGHWARAEDAPSPQRPPPGSANRRPEGLRFQAKAELQADGTTVELEYEFECGPRAEEGSAWKGSRASGVVLGGALAIMDGATKLLGVWRASEDEDGNGKMRMAFLGVRTVIPLREMNPLVESKLRELVGASPQDKPREVVQESKAPPAGMKLRVFPVPRAFLGMRDLGTAMRDSASREDKTSPLEALPADPFAPSAPSRSERVTILAPDRGNGELHSAKISFPEGCSASYTPKDSSLWVVHNPDGLQRIEEFVDSLWRQIPRTLVFHVEVVEADAAALREISDVASGIEGHIKGREMLEKLVESQKARIVEHHRLETLSGRRGQVSSLNAHTGAFEFEMQATLAADERALDAEMTLAQGKGVGTNLTSHVRLAAGVPRLVALWKPGDEGEGDKKVLRAAFVRAEVVPVEKPVRIKTPAKADDGTPVMK